MSPLYFSKAACREKDFFGRQMVPEIHPMAYQAVFQPEENWWVPSNAIKFSNSNLNLAVACVQKYVTFCDSLEWFHIEVSSVAFDSFYRAMEANHGLTVVLPFSAWCDAGTGEQDRHKHHKHMIAVSPTGHFIPNVWEKIHVSTADVPDIFKPIRKNRIVKFLQLIDTIGYLAQRNSICEGMQPKTKHNFYINLSLPRLFMWSVVAQFRNGLENLISDECIRRPIMDLAPIAKWRNDMYKVLIKDLPQIPLNLVFPVSRNFKPTKRPTIFGLHALGKRKIYFEKNDRMSLLPEDEWVQLQVEGGNILREVVGEYMWGASKKQQYYLGVIIPLMKKKEELEAEVESLKGQLAAPPKKKMKCVSVVQK